MRQLILIIIMAMIVAFLPVAFVKATVTDFNMEPNLVQIGAFYNGGKVIISGTISHDDEVIIRLSGNMKDVSLLKKGRVLGILWMNTDMITFHNIPDVYILSLPSAITESELDNYHGQKIAGLGFNLLKKQSVLTPVDEDKDFQFKEFVKLKAKEGVYAINENAVTYKNIDNNTKSFTCELLIPSLMAQGVYTVSTIILNKNRVIQSDDSKLKIKETGLPKMLNSLAYDHAVIYGILATLIAIAAGLFMGMIFKGQKGGH